MESGFFVREELNEARQRSFGCAVGHPAVVGDCTIACRGEDDYFAVGGICGGCEAGGAEIREA